MRDILAILDGQKIDVQATIDRFSRIRGYAGRHDLVACLVDVQTDAAEALCDHVWIRRGRRLQALDLHKGDRIAFTATVCPYTRVSGEGDYQFTRPYQCRVLERAAPPTPPEPAPEPVAPVATTAAPALPAKQRIIAAIEALGEAPSLPRLYTRCPMGPIGFLHHLHKLAKTGRVAFQPDGHIFVVPTVTEGVSL